MIFFGNTVISLVLSDGYFCAIIQIFCHPALTADLNCGIYLVISDIGDRGAAIEDGGWKIEDGD